MQFPIKFRGRDTNGNYVVGFLTKKIIDDFNWSWAIADFDCYPTKITPVTDFSPIIGIDDEGYLICAGDVITFKENGEPLSAELAVALVDKYGRHHYAPKDFDWFVEKVF